MSCYFLLQGIFLTQGSNPHLLCLLHCRQILYPLNHQGSSSEMRYRWLIMLGFPGSSVGKISCNAGDPDSIPESGRSPGKGIGYPLQYFWASLVAQMVKNLPAMRETWVWSLGSEDPLEEGMATHSSILGQRIPMNRGAWWAAVHGVTELDMIEWRSTQGYVSFRWTAKGLSHTYHVSTDIDIL